MPAKKKSYSTLGSISQQWFACFGLQAFEWKKLNSVKWFEILLFLGWIWWLQDETVGNNRINFFMIDFYRYGYWWLIELCVCVCHPNKQNLELLWNWDPSLDCTYIHLAMMIICLSVCLTFWRFLLKKQLHW